MGRITEAFVVQGMTDYDELVTVDTAGNWQEDGEEGLAVIDLHVHSAGDQTYASLTLKQAKQVRKALKKAIDLYES